jgi:hypothetical protein
MKYGQEKGRHLQMNTDGGKLNISEFCSVRRGVPFMIISALLTSSGNASNALINAYNQIFKVRLQTN